MNAEQQRLADDKAGRAKWRQWGPYLSERQWGTVREDYSPAARPGNIFRTITRAAAPIAGARTASPASATTSSICASSLALWNGKDPILKERLFGLTNAEGNHGEDVKELYYYLDATPTHSYLKMLYKYPQGEFPYARLVEENRAARQQDQPEFELLDTGIFDDDRYFDVFVEYAKAGPEDILMRVTVHNRGPEAATIASAAAAVVPQHLVLETGRGTSPKLRAGTDGARRDAEHPALGEFQSSYSTMATPDTAVLRKRNQRRAGFTARPTTPGFFKDAFHEYLDRRQSRRR